MSQSIFIQTHVGACLLQEDKVVSTPLGDYGGLPWLVNLGAGRAMDVNFENAYMGEKVLSSPFQNENMILGKGVHLNWMVPAFLGKEYGGKLNAAPNRWLVKKNNSKNSSFQRLSFQHFSFTQSPLSPRTPLFPASGQAIGSFNGLHPKSKFITIK
jgi:hypothetical protein